MRNISSTRSNPEARSAAPAAPALGDREALKAELLAEMTTWPARDQGGAFKLWHRHDLSLVHLNVLSLLQTEGALSMRRLAESMDVSDASATGIVDRMERRGLVERGRSGDDRRVVLVHPTETGGRVFDDLAIYRRETLSAVLEELSGEEMSALLKGMRALHAARRRVAVVQTGQPSEPDT